MSAAGHPGCSGDGPREAATATPPASVALQEERPALLERVGTTAVVRLYADGWNDLTPRQRILAWHLSRAALAGRDIYWDQMHRHGLAVRDLMEGLYRHREGLDPAFAEALMAYLKKLWIHNGFYDDRSRRKFGPGFDQAALRQAVSRALDGGAEPAHLGIPAGRAVEEHLAGLSRTLFDPDFEPLLTSKSPGPGGDSLRESAVNFYRDVTLREVEAWSGAGLEAHPLNSTLVQTGEGLEEEVWRAGTRDGQVPPGRYARAIEGIIARLEAALEFADQEQAEALRRLIRYYRTGEPVDWKAHGIAWVAHRQPVVDTINGFIEVYKDPRGRKGSYEGVVHVKDGERTQLMEALAARALAFERNAPWDDAFKRSDVTPPVATAVNVITAVGDAGPGCPLGVNLPNEEEIRERFGSKSVILVNVLRAYDAVSTRASAAEFAHPDELELARRHGDTVNFLQTAMHEVLGHASGAVSPGLTASPAVLLGRHYNALEEARAELVALHAFWDPMLREMGAVDSDEIPRAAYQAYARSGLVMLRRVKSGDVLQDDHMRATALIVGFLMDAGAVERVTLDGGKTCFRVANLEQMRASVAVLLAEVQRIKSTGDAVAAEKLIQTYAVRVDTGLRDEVVRRAEEAGLPDSFAAVMPRLEPVRDAAGQVQDVRAHHDEDLATQMLRFSALARQEGP